MKLPVKKFTLLVFLGIFFTLTLQAHDQEQGEAVPLPKAPCSLLLDKNGNGFFALWKLRWAAWFPKETRHMYAIVDGQKVYYKNVMPEENYKIIKKTRWMRSFWQRLTLAKLQSESNSPFPGVIPDATSHRFVEDTALGPILIDFSGGWFSPSVEISMPYLDTETLTQIHNSARLALVKTNRKHLAETGRSFTFRWTLVAGTKSTERYAPGFDEDNLVPFQYRIRLDYPDYISAAFLNEFVITLKRPKSRGADSDFSVPYTAFDENGNATPITSLIRTEHENLDLQASSVKALYLSELPLGLPREKRYMSIQEQYEFLK